MPSFNDAEPVSGPLRGHVEQIEALEAEQRQKRTHRDETAELERTIQTLRGDLEVNRAKK